MRACLVCLAYSLVPSAAFQPAPPPRVGRSSAPPPAIGSGGSNRNDVHVLRAVKLKKNKIKQEDKLPDLSQVGRVFLLLSLCTTELRPTTLVCFATQHSGREFPACSPVMRAKALLLLLLCRPCIYLLVISYFVIFSDGMPCSDHEETGLSLHTEPGTYDGTICIIMMRRIRCVQLQARSSSRAQQHSSTREQRYRRVRCR